jgi:hypothetical protein
VAHSRADAGGFKCSSAAHVCLLNLNCDYFIRPCRADMSSITPSKCVDWFDKRINQNAVNNGCHMNKWSRLSIIAVIFNIFFLSAKYMKWDKATLVLQAMYKCITIYNKIQYTLTHPYTLCYCCTNRMELCQKLFALSPNHRVTVAKT